MEIFFSLSESNVCLFTCPPRQMALFRIMLIMLPTLQKIKISHRNSDDLISNSNTIQDDCIIHISNFHSSHSRKEINSFKADIDIIFIFENITISERKVSTE